MSKIFTKNLHLKILALVAALFLWLYVVNEGYEVGFLDKEIRIETYNLAEDLAVAEDLGTAKLKVRAPATAWSKINVDEITAFVDLKNMREGVFSKEVKVSVEDSSMTILDIDPEKISVTLESIQALSKEVTVETSGDINEAYETQDPQISPAQVELKGSESTIEKVNKVVAPIQLAGEMTEVKKQVELEAWDANNQKITNLVIIPKTVEVTIPIRKQNEVKTIGIKANVIGEPASGYWVKQTTITPSTVAVQGDSEEISQLEYIGTQKIDITGVAVDTEKRVSLDLPTGVTAVDSDQVTVKVEIDTQTTTKATSANLKYIGLASNLIVTSASPSTVSLRVEGPTPELETLKSGDIMASINLTGKGSGSFSIPISSDIVSLPTGLTLKSIDTKEVKISIQKK